MRSPGRIDRSDKLLLKDRSDFDRSVGDGEFLGAFDRFFLRLAFDQVEAAQDLRLCSQNDCISTRAAAQIFPAIPPAVYLESAGTGRQARVEPVSSLIRGET